MNYGALIGRAWQITWRYKVLWIFGILLALTVSGGSTVSGGGGNGGGGSSAAMGSAAFAPMLASFLVLCCCALLFFIVVAVIVQYVARTALYRGVDQIEEAGVGPTWREGFRLGWSNRAFRMFLLDLIVGVAFALAAMLLIGLAALPLLLLIFDNEALRIMGVVATVGLEMLVFFGLIVAGVLISIGGQFWRREIALANRDIGAALSGGVALARNSAGNVGVMWVILTAIGLVFGLVTAMVFFGLAFMALGAGGGLGYAVYALTDSPALAFLVGLPIFLLITIVPMAIVRGIYLVFDSSAWTLVYRDVAGSATTSLATT
ncbi:MAG: hypothetical protein R2844_12645 [Caldilineales bacterium]